jgi:hypothetical protein
MSENRPNIELRQKPNKAPEPTTMAVTPRAPSSTSRASHGRGSSLTFGKNPRMKIPRFRTVILLVALGLPMKADTLPPPAVATVSGKANQTGAFPLRSDATVLDVWRECGGPSVTWGRIVRHYGLNADRQVVLLGEYRRRDFSSEEVWFRLLAMITVRDGDRFYFTEIVC